MNAVIDNRIGGAHKKEDRAIVSRAAKAILAAPENYAYPLFTMCEERGVLDMGIAKIPYGVLLEVAIDIPNDPEDRMLFFKVMTWHSPHADASQHEVKMWLNQLTNGAKQSIVTASVEA